ncbi:MAG: hypothetical protein ACRC8S_11545 [Fimbriiglobus sp.]
MRAPRVVMCSFDAILPDMLRPFVADQKWVFVELRKPEAILAQLVPDQPSVVFLQLDPEQASEVSWQLLVSCHQDWPDVPVVIISEAKLHDDDRPTWTATILGLGAKHVVFPPYTKLLLEDLAGGLMQATIERQTGSPPEALLLPTTETIDLAEGGYEDEA